MTPENTSQPTVQISSTESYLPSPTVTSLLRDWGRDLLAHNPFYPVSAGLLLLGIYLLCGDPKFLGGEESNLIFNLYILQGYEALLVGVAIILARRQIWYDATLLVVLENMLVLVPFILVTWAVLIGAELAWSLCLSGGVLVMIRFGSLRHWFRRLQLSNSILTAGALILGANLLLPFYYRPIMELDVADWEMPSEWLWLLALPSIHAAAYGLIHFGFLKRGTGNPSWLPLLMVCLWTSGSAVHLGSVGYVSNLPFQIHRLTPLFWIMTWTLAFGLSTCRPTINARTRSWLSAMPTLATLLATRSNDPHLFLTLTSLNLTLYTTAYFRHRSPAIGHLAVIALFALLAGVPAELGQEWLPEFSRGRAIVLSLGAYTMLQSLRSPRVDLAFLGGIMAGFMPGILANQILVHPGVQAGCLFMIMHGLRWDQDDSRDALRLRYLACLGWLGHSFIWFGSSGGNIGWLVCAEALMVGTLYGAARWLTGRWAPRIIPVAAGSAMLIHPIMQLYALAKSSPKGLLVVGASFLMFAIGTWVAWRKRDRCKT